MELSNILQRLFDKSSLEEIPLPALEELTRKHPYFAAGHFLLSGRLAGSDPERFRDQLQRTNLYFHDTLWLHHLIKRYQPASSLSAADRAPAAPPPPAELVETARVEDNLTKLPVADIPATGIEEATPEAEEADPLTAEAVPETEEAVPDTKEATSGVEEATAGIEVATRTTEQTASVEEEAVPVTEEAESDAAPALTFDPYHTIDYFASLGIRISQEIKPDDKLGNQLKSFTQWLKTMKRFPTGDAANPDTAQGSIQPFETARIEKIAAHSVEGKDIVTEAMAEVLIKQGKLEKARGIYHKLSLLNPDKNAYFAAKIEELKQY